MRGGVDDDVLTVPDDVWDAEKNSTHTINLRQTLPSTACLSIKVIYNNGWVTSAGGGNLAVAHQMANNVILEAQKIYNTKFAAANRLGTAITFVLVGGMYLHFLKYLSTSKLNFGYN